MTVVEAAPALSPPDGDGAPPAGSERGRRRGLLVILHTPSGSDAGAKVEIEGPVFSIGGSAADLAVDRATETDTRAIIEWESDGGAGAKSRWRVSGSGRLWVNGRAATKQTLVSGDELQVVESFFRFLCGTNAQEKYYETIYHMTIRDIPSGAHNQRYLREVLLRESERATSRGKVFSVAVVSIRPEPENQASAHSLVRTVVEGLGERVPSDYVIARTGEHECVVVGSEAAPVFEKYLESKLQRCLPERAEVHLGVVAHGPGLDTEEVVPKARAAAVPLLR